MTLRTPSTPAAAAIAVAIADPLASFAANVTANLKSAAPFSFGGASISGVVLAGAPQGNVQASASTVSSAAPAALAAAQGLPPGTSAGVAVAVIAALAASGLLGWREWRRRRDSAKVTPDDAFVRRDWRWGENSGSKVAPAPMGNDAVDQVHAAVSASAVAAERERAWSASSLHSEQQQQQQQQEQEQEQQQQFRARAASSVKGSAQIPRRKAAESLAIPGAVRAADGSEYEQNDEGEHGDVRGHGAARGRGGVPSPLLPPLLPPPALASGGAGGGQRSLQLPPLRLPPRYEPQGAMPAITETAVRGGREPLVAPRNSQV